MKPIVDGLEKTHSRDLTIIRLNIQEEMTQALAEEYGFEFTPTFIYFDASGTEQYRSVGSLDTIRIGELLKK